MATIALPSPRSPVTAPTMERAKPEISTSLPNTAPSRKTGKYSFRKPTSFSMNRPENKVGTADGSVSSTAPMAATGANRITEKPR